MDTTFGLDLARVEALFKRERDASTNCIRAPPRPTGKTAATGCTAHRCTGCNSGRATARCW